MATKTCKYFFQAQLAMGTPLGIHFVQISTQCMWIGVGGMRGGGGVGFVNFFFAGKRLIGVDCAALFS